MSELRHLGESQSVEIERHGRVEIIRMNRAGARNSLNREMLSQLQEALDTASGDPAVGAIVLTGAGTSFCAGADLKEARMDLEEETFWSQYDRATGSMRVHQTLWKSSKPTLAAVNGPAVAGGCGLAMSCDFVIASERAQFGYPEVNRGLVAAMVMVSLSRLVGRRQALDLLLSGRTIGPDEAKEIGLINCVVPHADLVPRTLERAAELADKSPSAIRLTKYLFAKVETADYDDAIEYARDLNQLVKVTGDARRGIAAFSNQWDAI